MSVHADAAKLVLQAYADGEVDVLDQLHARNYVDHSPLPGQGAGPAGLRERAMIFSSAFYDSHITTHVLVDNGDTVVLQARCRGVHKGEFYGVAATGRAVQTVGICVFRFVDGLIAASWSSFEIQGLLTSMTEPRDQATYSGELRRRLA
jgi:SnoaL-like polyketide cyclase.